MVNENYRKRAIDVRQNARAHLMEIRQARLARRMEIAEPMRGSRPAAAGMQTGNLAIEGERPRNSGTDQTNSTTSIHEPPTFDLEADDIGKEGEGDILDELALRNAAMPTGQEPNNEQDCKMPEPVDLVPPHGSEQLDPVQSELARLPGAGPGLIWMLSQCQVFTFQDLANQDADNLTAQLGVVGQIIDVGKWIEFAQNEA